MSDLDKLKDLLFGAEKQVLDSISERVESRELRSADVADILPEAIHDSHRNGKDLVRALQEPVGECLQEAFRTDPETYSDALYPIMGPAIRKAIMNALRTFAQQINTAVEQSFTPKGLSWRLQAWRAGVPLGDFIMQKTLLYRVEQAYLISRENGLLVGHAQHETATIKDSDAVSAMFTAIQDFVKESFSPDRTGRLETADMGEFTLWAVHGPHALLVCVIRGVPPRALRSDLSSILERIHFRFGDAIRSYTGDTSTVPDVETELAEALRFEARQEEPKSGKGKSVAGLAILLILGGAIVYLLVSAWMQSQKLGRLTAALENTPGIFVAESRVEDGILIVRGMRDPLAPSVTDVGESTGLSADELSADMRPFHSLEPALIVERASRKLGVPDGVSLAVQDERLIATGPASIAWQQKASASSSAVAGISSVEFVLTDEERTRAVREYLQPPTGVDVKAVPGGVELIGSAPATWTDNASQLIDAAQLDWSISIDSLESGSRDQLIEAVRRLDGQAFYFTSGETMTDQSEADITPYVRAVVTAAADLARFDTGLRVSVTGFADPTGNATTNQIVATRRAEAVAAEIAASGWSGEISTRANRPADDGNNGPNPRMRRAIVELALIEPATKQ